MEIATPFVVSVGIFDLPQFLPNIRSAFEVARLAGELKSGGKAGFATTLKDYKNDKQNILRAVPQAGEFVNAILSSTVKFAEGVGYHAPQNSLEMDNFWLIEMTSGSEHEVHSHYARQFSCCYYVDVPQNSGPLVFHSFRDRFDYMPPNIAEYTSHNSDTFGFVPKEGQFFIWESWVKHSVPATQFDGVRRCAAMDIIVHRG